MTETTCEIRRRMRAMRDSLSAQAIISASLAIADTLSHAPPIQRARYIGVYFAAFGEVDCGPFATRMEERGKTIFAPILRKNRLLFAPADSGQSTRLNRYGIAEPVYLESELRTAAELDVVIAPLVAFDNRLNRIGMGGGYYDRTLAFRKRRRIWRRPLVIGVAYSFQRVGAIRAQPWDVPLDAVITEKECYGSL